MAADPQMRWLRLWTDVLEDPKLLLLAPEDRWYFIGILVLKRSGLLDERDSAEMRDRKVALRLRLDHRERDEVRRRLMEVRLIDKDWQPTGWEKRQFDSDTSVTRTRKWRDKKRHGGGGNDGSVTSPKRHGDALRAETETETESEKDIRNARATEAPPLSTLPSPEAFRDLQRRYPSGTYRQSEWLLAERSLVQHLERGASLDEIRAGVERYRAQCDAKGSTGTQFVLSPSKFFDLTRPQFREPFPLPKTKAEAQQDQNIGAAKDWLAAGGAS